MNIAAGVVAGTLLGAAVGVIVFLWHLERADGNLVSF